MGATKQIPRDQWKTYFESFMKRHALTDPPKAATIEVLSSAIGDQFEGRVIRLLGLGYDPKSNALEVLLEDVDHLVFHPTEIWVIEEEGGFISYIEVVRSDGFKEIIQLQRSGPPAPRYESPLPP